MNFLQEALCGLEYAENALGELTTLPRPPSRLGRGDPHCTQRLRLLETSTLAPRSSGLPPTHNLWNATHSFVLLKCL